ncbi:hypothetical protein HQ560_18680 [bacterium]|nr:hypothetical protein [bacterium]
MSLLRVPLSAMSICVLSACAATARAGETGPALPEGVTKVSVSTCTGSEVTRYLAPGEWTPYGCGLAIPYLGGRVLRFEGDLHGEFVRIDDGPLRPSWIGSQDEDGLDRIKAALANGVRGFTILGARRWLAELDPIPAGSHVAVSGVPLTAEGVALLKRHPGVTAVYGSIKDDEGITALATLPQIVSLRLFSQQPCNLAPLARLRKLVYLRLYGKLDFASLPEMPALKGLKLWGDVSDFGFLARTPSLVSLHVRGCEATDYSPLTALGQLQALSLPSASLADLAPLAGLTKLQYLDLTGCKYITDFTPLRALVENGCTIDVDNHLKPKLEALQAKKIGF